MAGDRACLHGVRSGKTATVGYSWGQEAKVKLKLKDTGANPKFDVAKFGKGWRKAKAADLKVFKGAFGRTRYSARVVCGGEPSSLMAQGKCTNHPPVFGTRIREYSSDHEVMPQPMEWPVRGDLIQERIVLPLIGYIKPLMLARRTAAVPRRFCGCYNPAKRNMDASTSMTHRSPREISSWGLQCCI